MQFHAVLVEGLFFAGPEGDLRVQTEAGEEISVTGRLAPLVGQNVQVALHHVPSGGIDLAAWGWGSCQWKPADCPAGHHKKPGFLFSLAGNGVLLQDPWRLESGHGSSLLLEFEKMPGHHGRLAAASIPDVEAMKDELAQMDPDALGVKIGELHDMVQKLTGDKSK